MPTTNMGKAGNAINQAAGVAGAINPLWGLLLGGGSSLFNFLSQNSQRDSLEEEQRKKLEEYKASLKDMMYDPFEKAQALNGVEKVNNSSLAGALNQAALGTSNSMNSTQMKGALIAPMVSQNAQRMLEAQTKITDYNKDLEGKIANVDLSAQTIPQVDMGQILGEGVGTGLATYQMLDTMNNQKDILDLEKKRADKSMDFFKGMNTTSADSFLPWQKKMFNKTTTLFNNVF